MSKIELSTASAIPPAASAPRWSPKAWPLWSRWLAVLCVFLVHCYGFVLTIGFLCILSIVFLPCRAIHRLLGHSTLSAAAELVAAAWLMCAPLFYYYTNAVYEYSQGKASLIIPSKYYRVTEGFNIDPQLRCKRSPYFCSVDFRVIFQHPNNAAVPMMTSLFGYMPGAYSGPYPSKAEAMEAIATRGKPVECADLIADRVVLGTETYQLAAGEGRRFFRHWNLEFFQTEAGRAFLDARPPFRAVVWKEGCLVLGLPIQAVDPNHQDAEVMLYMAISIDAGKAFAIYCDGDTNQYRLPRVHWQRDL